MAKLLTRDPFSLFHGTAEKQFLDFGIFGRTQFPNASDHCGGMHSSSEFVKKRDMYASHYRQTMTSDVSKSKKRKYTSFSIDEILSEDPDFHAEESTGAMSDPSNQIESSRTSFQTGFGVQDLEIRTSTLSLRWPLQSLSETMLNQSTLSDSICLRSNSQVRCEAPCHSKENVSTGKRRLRTVFTKIQLAELESVFCRKQYLVGIERYHMAKSLQLTENQVKVWFQNRRIKHRKQKQNANTSSTDSNIGDDVDRPT